jgi:hypothetical protein
MQTALLNISNPDQCMTHEQVDGHEFSFHSRTPSSRPEPQTCLSQTSPAHSPSKQHHSEVDLDDDHPADIPVNPFPDPAPHSRPSDYLRSCCSICFGGEFPCISCTG